MESPSTNLSRPGKSADYDATSRSCGYRSCSRGATTTCFEYRLGARHPVSMDGELDQHDLVDHQKKCGPVAAEIDNRDPATLGSPKTREGKSIIPI